MTTDTNNFSFLTKSASRMMDCNGYIKLNISCHSSLYVFTQYTAFFNREAKTQDFTCPDPFNLVCILEGSESMTVVGFLSTLTLKGKIMNITFVLYMNGFLFLAAQEFLKPFIFSGWGSIYTFFYLLLLVKTI